jgi:hypothetical protein
MTQHLRERSHMTYRHQIRFLKPSALYSEKITRKLGIIGDPLDVEL